jgi:hypothetical protein
MTPSKESLAKAREICKIDFFEMWGKETWTFNKDDLSALVCSVATALDAAKVAPSDNDINAFRAELVAKLTEDGHQRFIIEIVKVVFEATIYWYRNKMWINDDHKPDNKAFIDALPHKKMENKDNV